MYRADREAQMADFKRTPQGASSHVNPGHPAARRAATPARQMGKAANVLGAVMSLALVVGVGVWGYKLLVRDVSGIPVVRAAAGEMRVRPEVPGGRMAEHQGLSVNTVAAIGSADARADQLRLAPQPTQLVEEDLPMALIEQVGSEVEALPVPDLPPNATTGLFPDMATALETGNIDELVAQLTSGVDAMEVLEAAADESVPVLVSASAPVAVPGAGLSVSLRPSLRPANASSSTNTARAQATPVSASAVAEMDAASVPAGTRLVQLGAFDTPQIARAQWDALGSRFAPFMEGKTRIVMQAQSGGRTFYRLRAEGFSDIGDARRFCSALVAESVDCIPVVSR